MRCDQMRRAIALCVVSAMWVEAAAAQSPIAVDQPTTPLIRWYKADYIPPVRLSNSSRLHELIRAGNLYLSLQDAIALAIENSLDLEIDRYGPLQAEWALKRDEA